MASPAAIKHKALVARAAIILKADRSSLHREEVQAVYGAACVAEVAAWNAYVIECVTCFFKEVANPVVPHFHALHTLANGAATLQLGRFNTPNAENTRNLLTHCTGYDPWNDWQWPARGMNALSVQQRLNEILKVRHSIAHGFDMPGYVWTQAPSGETRLTLEALASIRSFLKHLVATTDKGLRNHLVNVYGAVPRW
jgi:hypothetical protein